MKRYFNLAFLLLLSLAGVLLISLPVSAKIDNLPTGELVTGRIDHVPEGTLVVSVNSIAVSGMGGEAHFNGPSGFLITLSGEAEVTGGPLIRGRGAIFLQGGKDYNIRTTVDWPANFLFIGLGRVSEIDDAKPSAIADTLYETKPLPWGPGQGKVYDVSINRERFSTGGATPWHYHTGPAFGILDGGDWENRQATGITERIQMPGYYLQPAGPIHQLAQVGDGGIAYIIQFYPPGQPKTGGGVGVAAATPTVVVEVATPIAAAKGHNLSVPAVSNVLLTSPTATPYPTVPPHGETEVVSDTRDMVAGIWAVGIVASIVMLVALFLLMRAQRR
jgi:hypothetical protein